MYKSNSRLSSLSRKWSQLVSSILFLNDGEKVPNRTPLPKVLDKFTTLFFDHLNPTHTKTSYKSPPLIYLPIYC